MDHNTATEDMIFVEAGVNANIILAGVNINVGTTWNDYDDCPLRIADNSTGDVTITIQDGTTNTLTKEYDFVIKRAPITYVQPTQAANEITYGQSLASVGLTVGGWYWANSEEIPVVNNNGYVVEKDVDDTNKDYSGIEGYDAEAHKIRRTIAVTVNKATPYMMTAPTAVAITYGKTLKDSALSGGTVQYSETEETVVAGTWSWKEETTKPVVADSETTQYEVVFTPTDAENYNVIETKITLTVNKSETTPNMPESTMNVLYSQKTVGDVKLPEGWVWNEADKSTAHTWDNGVVTKEATATEKGEKTYTCSVCKTTKKEEIPAPGAPEVGTTNTSDDGKATYKVTTSNLTNGTVTYVAPTNKKATTVTIPDTVVMDGVTYKVTSVEKKAFKNNKKIKKVTIGKNVSKIGSKAFYGCSKLKTLTIKSSKLTTKKIGSKAFSKTPKSMTVKVPKKKFKTYKSMLIKRGVNKKAKFKKS